MDETNQQSAEGAHVAPIGGEDIHLISIRSFLESHRINLVSVLVPIRRLFYEGQVILIEIINSLTLMLCSADDLPRAHDAIGGGEIHVCGCVRQMFILGLE